MTPRALAGPLADLAFRRRKIALLSGPRQCGKTTLARMLLASRAAGAYRTWDDVEFRRAWARDPKSVLPRGRGRAAPLLVLDELHKDRRWKGALKGLYDTLARPCDVLVTGSARLDVHVRAKGSDSLLGRYLHFRLHAFTLREMSRPDVPRPDEFLDGLFGGGTPARKADEAHLADLLVYGPFPEPLFAQDERFARLWRRNRERIVVREELRDLSRLPELGRVELLTALLPERVGSPFSVAALREDLEVSFDTVKRWTAFLHTLYYLFELKPYSRNLPRSLKREGKVYLWDWSSVPRAPARFENLVASHLQKACHYWTDTGEGDFRLWYLRTKERDEIDFLVVRDGEPWLPVEVKSGDQGLSPQWAKFSRLLPCRRGIQLVRGAARRVHRLGPAEVLVVGAAEALAELV
jgi:hypothetical protein